MDASHISEIIQRLVLIAPGFLLGITIHELGHAYVAYRYGDPTAKMQGRLTFNPISHLDPMGTLCLVISSIAGVGIGWAKPVPVDPRYLRNPRKDMLWISLAGPAANLALATALAVLLHALLFAAVGRPLGETARFVLEPLLGILVSGVTVNVMLAVLNLFPIPPLDGSKILAGLLPAHLAQYVYQLEPYGFFIFLFLIFAGLLHYIIGPPIYFVTNLLLHPPV